MTSAIVPAGRAPSAAYRLGNALRVWSVQPVSSTARELVAQRRLVSLTNPPDWLTRIAGVVTLVYEIGLLLAATARSVAFLQWPGVHDWLGKNGLALVLGLGLGGVLVYTVACLVTWAVANLVLIPAQLLLFPFLLAIGLVRRLVACRRVLHRMLDALAQWLPPPEIVELCRLLVPCLPTQVALEWGCLTREQVLSRWIELQPAAWHAHLRPTLWPELVLPGLSAAAVPAVLRRCMQQDEAVRAAVLAAAIGRGWFARRDCGPALTREFARLPAVTLASALEQTSALGRERRQNAVRSLLQEAQRLNDAQVTAHFQDALAYVPIEVCDDALRPE